MYLSRVTIENFRCFGDGDQRTELELNPGLTALVGQNDSGKTAIIDALRFALGTTDQEWYRLEDTDFHEGNTSHEIKITCTFEGLSGSDKRAFLEYLTYVEGQENGVNLHVHWTAKDTGQIRNGRSYRRVSVHSGKNGDGPIIVPEVRDLLRATYLRPLRDAEQALSAGRGSRLSQVMRHSAVTSTGDCYDSSKLLSDQNLSILEIGKLLEELLLQQEGLIATRTNVDTHLKKLSLVGDRLKSRIQVGGVTSKDNIRLRQLLEKLDLVLEGAGKMGLGSDNLLFMACELLLLVQEEEGNKLLLIEEPEAHLHAQRQLQVIKYMQEQAESKGIQVIVTTHSPNLASAIKLNNLVMIQSNRAYSMAQGQTKLQATDYRFLERFLDVTKANLFFARGVMIVEGDAENILLPTLANLIGRDFTEYGVSIVNVGGVGLRRYACIFQREDEGNDGQLNIPVACVTDMDVMPDCAPTIIGKLKEGDAWPKDRKNRRWRAKKDFESRAALAQHRQEKRDKASGQSVKTFVSGEWTLEYDLAYCGLAEEVYVAVHLAKKEVSLDDSTLNTEIDVAKKEFVTLKEEAEDAVSGGCPNGCLKEEYLAARVYAQFTTGTKASKAIAAQYLAELLRKKQEGGEIDTERFRTMLPAYLTDSIDYVTGGPNARESGASKDELQDE